MAILKSIKDKIKGSGPVKARPRSDEDVAKAVADYSAKKAEAIRKKLADKKRERESKEKQLKDIGKKVRMIRRSEESLGDRYKRLAERKRSELVDDYRKLITKLKLHPLVDGFDVDTKKRVLVTTKPIKIKKDRWKKVKIAGVYQIRIDFSKEKYSDGIQILNLTQRHKEYDSPVIANTRPCWGNIGPDIETEFNSQDLYELIIDLVDYISSPKDKDGHLQWSESKDTDYQGGWEQFFSKRKKQPKNYSFEKYDQDVKAGKIDGVTSVPAEAIRNAMVSSSIVPLRINNSLSPSLAEIERSGMDIRSALHGMGFRDDAATYFTRLILMDSSRRDVIPVEIELEISRIGTELEGAILYVSRQTRRELAAGSSNRDRVDKFFVNKLDINESAWETLRQRGRMRYVISPSTQLTEEI